MHFYIFSWNGSNYDSYGILWAYDANAGSNDANDEPNTTISTALRVPMYNGVMDYIFVLRHNSR